MEMKDRTKVGKTTANAEKGSGEEDGDEDEMAVGEDI
jgi:hypothetical protein